MSMFEDGKYRWRETYFVLFPSGSRPTLKAVEETLSALNENYTLTNLSADESGLCESLTLLSPDDFAALDICYVGGAEVLEHGAELAGEMESGAVEASEKAALQQVRQYDGRFDVLHFERLSEFPDEGEEADEILDPSALILVLGALAQLTGGIAIDPQAGSILECNE